MSLTSDTITLRILIFLCILLGVLLIYVLAKKNKKQLDKIFIIIFILLLVFLATSISMVFYTRDTDTYPIYLDQLGISILCLLPVACLFMALIFSNTKVTIKRRHALLFIIPILTLILVWTNDLHHLFYEEFSTNTSDLVYGPYFYVHYIYTYLLFAIALFILIKYSIKNSGFFSKQAVLIFIGSFIPIITNLLGYTKIIPMSIYMTPITFTFTIIFFALAMFKFNLFKVTPIALQRIVDRMSDSYIVLSDDYSISDFNRTFIVTFHIRNSSDIRGKSFEKLLKESNLDLNIDKFKIHIEKVKNNDNTESFELHLSAIKKYFNVEITSIMVNGQSLGTLVLFKDITQHTQDMQNLKDNQSLLMEKERFASLGQMIGGIAHNLKTPIMSISGATEALNDLVTEYDASIGDPDVTAEDHHAIASDMYSWISKVKTHASYMSDVITAVKGQAVENSGVSESFTVDELVKRVNILMKHELKNALVELNIDMRVLGDLVLHGNVNSLVQVINNLISNAIQSYNGAPNNKIDLILEMIENSLVISVRDYGCGMSSDVKQKLFKEMITTKGKNGTGLGLFMSYSNIRAHFNGTMTFDSDLGKGTIFNIVLPL